MGEIYCVKRKRVKKSSYANTDFFFWIRMMWWSLFLFQCRLDNHFQCTRTILNYLNLFNLLLQILVCVCVCRFDRVFSSSSSSFMFKMYASGKIGNSSEAAFVVWKRYSLLADFYICAVFQMNLHIRINRRSIRINK